MNDRPTPDQLERPDFEEEAPKLPDAAALTLTDVAHELRSMNAYLRLVLTEQRANTASIRALEERAAAIEERQTRSTEVQEAQNKHLDSLTQAVLQKRYRPRVNGGGL